MHSLGALFADQARSSGDRPALWCKGETLTYGELLERAAGIAGVLHARGSVSAETRIAILSDRTPTAYAGILAALVAGAAYVPLNPRFPPARNRAILAKSGASVLICDRRNSAFLGEIADGLAGLETIVLPESSEPLPDLAPLQLTQADLGSAPADLAALPCERESNPLAYIFFTSGSTGEPKGVPISHANVLAYLEGIRTVCDITPEDRVSQLVDLTFDLSVHDMFLAWLSGATLYSVPENAALLATRFVGEHDITAWLSVPSTASLIKQSGLLDPGSMPTLRWSFFCGEALPGGVAEAWAAAAPNSAIGNIYGPTEATVAFSAYPYAPGQAEPPSVVPLGWPFPGQRMALFDSEGNEVRDGTGEICLSGSQVMSGYWNAPELTAARFLESGGHRWYRTGDLGRYDPDQGFIYLGRADHQVKIRGYRVELQEIEAVVRRVTGCEVVAVLAWPADPGAAALGCVAFALNRPGDEAASIEACRAHLPDYMVPMRIFSLGEMPFNSNGKVDYVALRQHRCLSELREPAAS